MQNSFSLGLLHGALYGITPLTPWFIGLKRYVFEGQAKGLLTFAGLFLGQVGLLLVAFFGRSHCILILKISYEFFNQIYCWMQFFWSLH